MNVWNIIIIVKSSSGVLSRPENVHMCARWVRGPRLVGPQRHAGGRRRSSWRRSLGAGKEGGARAAWRRPARRLKLPIVLGSNFQLRGEGRRARRTRIGGSPFLFPLRSIPFSSLHLSFSRPLCTKKIPVGRISPLSSEISLLAVYTPKVFSRCCGAPRSEPECLLKVKRWARHQSPYSRG